MLHWPSVPANIRPAARDELNNPSVKFMNSSLQLSKISAHSRAVGALANENTVATDRIHIPLLRECELLYLVSYVLCLVYRICRRTSRKAVQIAYCPASGNIGAFPIDMLGSSRFSSR